jgi:hypothetical protein
VKVLHWFYRWLTESLKLAGVEALRRYDWDWFMARRAG